MSSSSETDHKPQPETESIPTSALLLASVGLCIFLIVVIAASVYGVRGLATKEHRRKELIRNELVPQAQTVKDPSVGRELEAIREAMESMANEGRVTVESKEGPAADSGKPTGTGE